MKALEAAKVLARLRTKNSLDCVLGERRERERGRIKKTKTM